MTRHMTRLALLFTSFGLLSAPLPVAAQSKTADPLAFYKEYLGVLAKATSLDPLLPYFTKEIATGMANMPKDMQANYLKMNKRIVSDVKATKQDVAADKAELQLSAKDSDGQAVTGSASLVKEGGAWKIDDFTWAGPPPKQ